MRAWAQRALGRVALVAALVVLWPPGGTLFSAGGTLFSAVLWPPGGTLFSAGGTLFSAGGTVAAGPASGGLLGVGAARAQPPGGGFGGVPIESPEGLRRFAERLRAVEGGAAQRVRVTHFGDSHIAADLLTAPLRAGLQARYGDGGRGFLLAGRPWPSYRQGQMRAESQGDWRVDGLRGGVEDGWYGLGGCSAATADPAARIELAGGSGGVGARLDAVDLHFLRQPGGGCLEVRANGAVLGRVATAGPWTSAGFARVPIPIELGPTPAISLHPLGGGEVRLFGASFEAYTGFIWDAFGINGAQAHRLLRPDAQGFADGLARLAPDLVVLSYGTNELFGGGLDLGRHAEHLRRVLQRVRAAAPQADCLLTGPPDFLRKGRPVPETPGLYAVHRGLAAEHGCAFWDAQSAMGGPGSVRQWRRQGLAQRDFVHLTRDGYVRLGEALLGALLAAVEGP